MQSTVDNKTKWLLHVQKRSVMFLKAQSCISNHNCIVLKCLVRRYVKIFKKIQVWLTGAPNILSRARWRKPSLNLNYCIVPAVSQCHGPQIARILLQIIGVKKKKSILYSATVMLACGIQHRETVYIPPPKPAPEALKEKKKAVVFLCIKGIAYIPLSKICAPFPLPTPEPCHVCMYIYII